MALQITVSRTPEQLAADATALSTVDWPRVWQGYGRQDPATWCESFGWELTLIGRNDNCTVRLASGGQFRLGRQWHTGERTSIEEGIVLGWGVDAETTPDNTGILDEAGEQWPRYLKALQASLGTPHILTRWDDPEYPDLPFFQRTEKRVLHRQPYRLAVWRLNGALAVLRASPSDDVIDMEIPGGLSLDLVVRADVPGRP